MEKSLCSGSDDNLNTRNKIYFPCFINSVSLSLPHCYKWPEASGPRQRRDRWLTAQRHAFRSDA